MKEAYNFFDWDTQKGNNMVSISFSLRLHRGKISKLWDVVHYDHKAYLFIWLLLCRILLQEEVGRVDVTGRQKYKYHHDGQVIKADRVK